MIKRLENSLYLYENDCIIAGDAMKPSEIKSKLKALGKDISFEDAALSPQSAKNNTMAYSVLNAHHQQGSGFRIKFDALTSHDITYVGIVQTARASGMTEFPVPYVMTNCHNSLCAVGGTINEDDHIFGLSAAKKYGGIFVPAHLAVIHQYMREMFAGCGKMILGSDSHTRYGALGTLGIGEGGPEIVKQLLSNTYDIEKPDVIMVYLKGSPQKGVGPQDVALAIIGEVFKDGFVKNKILEFCGEGVSNLSMDYRMGIDVMTTETTCLSSIWTTDGKTKAYLETHHRSSDYQQMSPGQIAFYDGGLIVDLDKIEPMIALPFHPSNVYTIRELNENPQDILSKVEKDAQKQFPAFTLTDKIHNGVLTVDQGVIAGCAGGMYENICEAAAILDGANTGDGYFGLSVYPSSQPVNMALTQNGVLNKLMEAGAVIRSAFCGPCFGAGDVPGNNGLSIRHTTRNFPNREGSKPDMEQIASVALMDARSIAATAKNGGRLTAATEVDYTVPSLPYAFNNAAYEKRVYQGFGKPRPQEALRFGPNIADWPKMYPLTENLLLKVACVIKDPVTTTDELIPSGETSSYRSNPYKLSEFTLSRRDPEYVGKAKAIRSIEENRREGNIPQEMVDALEQAGESPDLIRHTAFGSVIFANRPGDGSAREQAASCQKVLGGFANIAVEYATKRYRSNLINWGMIPFTLKEGSAFNYQSGDYILIKGIRSAIEKGQETIDAQVITDGGTYDLALLCQQLNATEREIILQGSLINYYASKKK